MSNLVIYLVIIIIALFALIIFLIRGIWKRVKKKREIPSKILEDFENLQNLYEDMIKTKDSNGNIPNKQEILWQFVKNKQYGISNERRIINNVDQINLPTTTSGLSGQEENRGARTEGEGAGTDEVSGDSSGRYDVQAPIAPKNDADRTRNPVSTKKHRRGIFGKRR